MSKNTVRAAATCAMGVGCEESGICFSESLGSPLGCPRFADTASTFPPGPYEVWPSLYEGFAAAVVINTEPLRTLAEVRDFRVAQLFAAAPTLYGLVRLVARMEHSGDDGFSWLNNDPDDDRATLDSLIAMARDNLGNAPRGDGGMGPATHEAGDDNGLNPNLPQGQSTNGLNP